MRFPIKVVYVAGPISPGCGRTMRDNIELARETAIEIWKRGAYPFTPHLNSTDGVQHGFVPGSEIYLADLEMLERCDAVFLSFYWKQSRGANLEAAWARYKGLPTFESFAELERWLDGQ